MRRTRRRSARRRRARPCALWLQYFAAVFHNRPDHTVEELVQSREVGVAGQRFRHGRGTTEVREPDEGVDGFTVAPLDQSIKHSLPCVLAEIGDEQCRGRHLQGLHLEQTAQQRQNLIKPSQISNSESTSNRSREGIVKVTDCRLISAFLHEANLLKLRRAAIDNLPRFRSVSG